MFWALVHEVKHSPSSHLFGSPKHLASNRVQVSRISQGVMKGWWALRGGLSHAEVHKGLLGLGYCRPKLRVSPRRKVQIGKPRQGSWEGQRGCESRQRWGSWLQISGHSAVLVCWQSTTPQCFGAPQGKGAAQEGLPKSMLFPLGLLLPS